MKSRTTVLLAVLMLMASVNLWAQQQLTVAVRGFETSGGLTQDEGNAITDIFISELVSTGKVKVVDRNSFEAIIAEMKFQASDWSDNNNVVRLGKALKANHIIQGSVTSLGGRIVITVRVLDISTVQFVASPNLQLVNMDEIFAKLKPFVVDLVCNLPGVSHIYQVGDIGPSGGYVYYDQGAYTNGWRYLEVAPASVEFKSYKSEAPGKCSTINVNGLTGWRLPSKEELQIMYNVLKQKGLGSFQDSLYRSSTYYNNIRQMGGGWTSGYDGYYTFHFKSGNHSTDDDGEKLVRPVRNF